MTVYQNHHSLSVLMQKSILFLLLFYCLTGCTETKSPATSSIENSYKGYNILWLVTEDMSAYIPPFGDSTVLTPNLSRLAAEGVRFTNLYSPSGVCSPSRYAIATGRYPSSDGAQHMRVGKANAIMASIGLKDYEVVPPSEVKLMGELMRSEGYYCSNNVKTDYQLTANATTWDENSQSAHWRNRTPDQPFFSIFNFTITHESQFFNIPSKFSWRYFEDFPQPGLKNSSGERIDSSTWKLNPMQKAPPIPPYLPDTEVIKKDIATMYSNIVYMDEQVGIILDQLENDGLLDNTIIAWYADHGGPLPRQKRLIYDAGLKAPMIVRFPDQQNAGTIDDQLMSFVDLAPTFMSIIGLPPAEFHQGQPRLGEFESPKSRSYIYAAVDRLDEHYDMQRAVKDNRYKYIKNYYPEKPYYQSIAYREQIASMKELLKMRDAGELNEIQMQWFRKTKDKEELFDTWNDPHELNNIAGQSDMQDKLIELRTACEDWMSTINDRGNQPEIEMAQEFWPNWVQPQVPMPSFSEENGNHIISCQMNNASIGYQILDESGILKDSWQVYKEPIQIGTTEKVIAIADRLGWKPSEIVFSSK